MYGLTTLFTGLDPQRIGNLICYSHLCHEFPGAFAEFGVYKGGSLELVAKQHPQRKIYGIDSFKGLPEPTESDTHRKGDFSLSNEAFTEIEKYFTRNHPNVSILKGFSPDVFNSIGDERFAFVHIDVDMYSSVSHALDFFYPRLCEGGMLLFDDYGFDTTPGAKKAIDEWVAGNKCKHAKELRIANNRFCGQYLIIK